MYLFSTILEQSYKPFAVIFVVKGVVGRFRIPVLYSFIMTIIICIYKFTSVLMSLIYVCFFYLSADPQNECVVCMDSSRDSLLVPCHYDLCVCSTCADTLKADQGLCPVCRQNITDVIRVYQP